MSTTAKEQENSSGSTVNKVRYIALGKEETKENWDKFSDFALPFLRKEGYEWIIKREHTDLPDENETEIRGDDVYGLKKDNQGNKKWVKLSDKLSTLYKSNASVINFLTQCIGEKPQLLKELKMNGRLDAWKWWTYLVKKFNTQDKAKCHADFGSTIKQIESN
ncbi:hypothetical protein ACA910_018355 [Epithemia clementina (nom. ined.)]